MSDIWGIKNKGLKTLFKIENDEIIDNYEI